MEPMGWGDLMSPPSPARWHGFPEPPEPMGTYGNL